MADATFQTPDLATFARLDTPGFRVTGQFLEPDRACWPAVSWSAMTAAGAAASKVGPRDSTTRRLAHEPFGWRPTTFTTAEKREHVLAVDAAVAAGDGSGRAHLRLRGLYAASVSEWRLLRDAGVLDSPLRSGPR